MAVRDSRPSARAALASPQAPPPELTALLARARIDAPVSASCRAEFERGKRRAYAVAVATSGEGGRYVALEGDGEMVELAPFQGSPDLACYTRAEATKLGVTLGQSETIHGSLKPRWNTTVVCGFTDATSATCWQYSERERRFVVVGRWIT